MAGWLFASALVGCGPTKPEVPPSLVLVTLDTVRADHLSSYGYAVPGGPPVQTPVLDSFAEHGIRFDQAYTTSPQTLPAHASIMTGLWPPSTGIRVNGDHSLPDEVETLAERLKAAGWSTAASVGAYPMTRIWNFDQGFDLYLDEMAHGADRWSAQRPGAEVVKDLQMHLRELPADKPVFLWVHLYDAHEPYQAPAVFQRRGPYDAEIAFLEGQISWFRDALEKAPDGRKYAWILVGDHGEGFAGDRELGHGVFLDPATTRVPFLVRPVEPLETGIVVDTPVSVVDVVSTALGLVGLPPAEGTDGVDLSGATGAVQRGPLYLEAEAPVRWGFAPEVAVIDGPSVWYGTPHGGWFDRSVGWTPDGDQSASHGPQVDAARAFADGIRAREPVGVGLDLGGLTAQLAALGYAGPPPAPAAASSIDAKDRAADIARMQEARRLARDPGSREAAAEVWRELLASAPDLVEPRVGLVSLLSDARAFDEADALLTDGLARDPRSPVLLLDRGRLRLQLGRMPEAEADARALLAVDPTSRNARDLLISSLKLDAALAQIGEWQQAAPDDPFLHAKAGQVLLLMRRLPEARAELQLASQAEVPWLGVHRAQAAIAFQEGDAATTWKELSAELALFPEDRAAWHALGDYLVGQGKLDEARELYSRLLATHPDDQPARLTIAEILLRRGDLDGADAMIAPMVPSDDPRIVIVWANLLRARGETAKADEALERARAPKR